ncbi:SPW repeat protein [Streptomyces sp. NPDC088354]|uniref:SPW repeat protein n=1 Tax=unclassified Streptomyces TaxID=2593676 RepID=UPI0029BEEECA|nr:SPW repeat protein [Streptomyces sp. MI02-7b]MDX3074087.1 SPW repeat protein [Streptomyces sp. MI02-7b]
MSRTQPGIEQHPDLLELRADYERATATNRGQAVEAMGLLIGTYLAASPWIAGFNAIFGFSTLSTIAVNNLIAGIAYALLMGGVGRGFERTHSKAWAAAVIALWTIISPWCVAGDVSNWRTITNNVIVGVIGLVVALAAATTRPGSARTAGHTMSDTPGGMRRG